MNNENMQNLSLIRYERAKELLEEAKNLLSNESYKSANNRAFYSSEKAIKSVLATIGKDSASHVGLIQTFNQEFIHTPSEFFDQDDFRDLQSMERVRNSSDYDDFYITSKAECTDQVKKAEKLLGKVEAFLKAQDIIKT